MSIRAIIRFRPASRIVTGLSLSVFGCRGSVSSLGSLCKRPSALVGIPSCPTMASRSIYTVVERGSPNTPNYRVYIAGPNGFVSPFHDIPLYADQELKIFNMVVEVPRWTNAKMEIDREEKLNPIKQDVKKGKLRYVDNCFPFHGYIWNYGAIPQTWEDPQHIDEHTKQKGDNDPIDVCEIGSKVHKRGDVIQVKVLAIMALVDEGETDWKVLAIDVNDPLAKSLNDIGDVEKHRPGLLKATNQWFKIYKVPSGKPQNQFAFDGKAQNRAFALQIIQQTNQQWKRLVCQQSNVGSISCANTTICGTPGYISQDQAKTFVDLAAPRGCPEPIPPEVDTWHYV